MKDKLKILIRTLKSSFKIINDYILLIPENEMEVKRGEDAWTIKEHLAHLDQVQDLLLERLLKFKNEENPVITPFFPDKEKKTKKFKTAEAAMKSFKRKRNKQIKLINEMTDSDFKKEGTHGQYKKYNLEIVLNHMMFHDYWHMYRIEELWLTKDQ